MTKRPRLTAIRAAAALLGRKGGRATTAAKRAAVARNGQQGGRPSLYRVTLGTLEHRTGTTWTPVAVPFNAAARVYLRRHPEVDAQLHPVVTTGGAR